MNGYNLAWDLRCHSRFDYFDFVLRSQVCQKYELQIVCFGFSSSLIERLHGCYIHLKGYAQYDLCDAGVYSREIINMFFVGQVFRLGIYSDTINMVNVKLCMMVQLIELYLFIPLSVTLTVYKGHSNVEQFYLKLLCSCQIKLNFVELLSKLGR